MKKLIVSYTQISMYRRCGEQYRRRYIEKDVIPPGIALLKGGSVHKGAEYNYKQKIKTHLDLKPKEVIDYSVDTLERRIEHEGLFLAPEEESVGKAKIVGEAKDRTVTMASVFMEKVAPVYQPKQVEYDKILHLEHSDYDLRCIIDLIDTRDQIVELKTSSRETWSQDKVDHNDQLTFQSLLYEAEYKRPPEKLILENIRESSKDNHDCFETRRTHDDYDRHIVRINRIVNGINKGVFTPASEDSWACSPKFCGYWNTCKVRK